MDIIIDIETLPCRAADPVWRALADDRFSVDGYPGPPKNYKDPAKIEAHRQKWVDELADKEEDARLKTSLNGSLGGIACIVLATRASDGWRFQSHHPPIGDPEVWGTPTWDRKLLRDFRLRFDSPRWVGWNVDFDVTFLILRALALGFPLDLTFGALDAPKWERPIVDLARLHPGSSTFGTGGGRYPMSLKHAWATTHSARAVKDPDVSSGSDVARLLAEGKTADIVAHCMHDVEKTVDMYERLAPMTKGLS